MILVPGHKHVELRYFVLWLGSDQYGALLHQFYNIHAALALGQKTAVGAYQSLTKLATLVRK